MAPRYDDLEDDHRGTEASSGALAAIRQKRSEVLDVLKNETGASGRYTARLVEVLGAFGDPALWDLREWEADYLLEAMTTFADGSAADHEVTSRSINSAIADVFQARRTQDFDQLTQEKYDIVDRVRLLDQAEAAAARAERAEDSVREVAGERSAYALGEHYSEVAFEEEERANWFRRGAIAALILGASLSVFLPLGEGLEVAQIYRRASVLLTTFAIAGYLAREAGQHRKQGREFRSSEVRIKSLWGFAEGFSDQQTRQNFLSVVGASLFTPQTERTDSDASAPASIGVDHLLALLTRAGDRQAPRNP